VGKENALLSRRLVQLNNQVPIEIDWTEYQGFDAAKLRGLFQRFGFKSLMGRLDGRRQTADGSREPATASPDSNKLFPDENQISTIPTNLLPSAVCRLPSAPAVCRLPSFTYHLIDTPEKFTDFLTQLQQQSLFSIDTETAPMENRFEATSPRYTVIVGMSFAWNDSEAWYLPFRAPLGSPTLPQEKTLEQLRPILEDANIKKIGQNLKYDSVVLRNAGVHLRGIAFDTMLADYLLRPEMTHNLDDMAEHYLGYKTIKISELIGTGTKQKRMDTVPTETLAEYAGEDALVAWHLYQVLKEKL